MTNVSESLKGDIVNIFNLQDYDTAEKKAQFLVSKGYSDPWLCNILAVIYAKQKKFTLAAKYFKILTELFPNNYESFFNLGNLYRDTKELYKSKYHYSLALQKKPSHFDSSFELAKIYFSEKNFEQATYYLQGAKKIKKDSFEVEDLIGQILFSTGKFIESLKQYRNLLKFSNNNNKEKILVNIASNLIELGQIKEAKTILRECKSENGRYNLSLINIKERNLVSGWKDYDLGVSNGNRKVRNINYISSKLELWDINSDCASVVVLGEQGIGDEIMYSPLINHLIEAQIKTGLLMDFRLKGLLSRSIKNHEFLENECEAIDKGYKAYIPIGSLCQFYRKNYNDFQKNNIYFKTDKKRVEQLKNKFTSSKPKIGVSWHTESSSHGRYRNIKLKKFSNLFKNINAEFINLQYGDHSIDIERLSKKLGKNIFLNDDIDNKNDLEGLSAKIDVCDLIISIDNSTLHLAGTLNKETIGLIPDIGDWRWMNYPEKTPWYKSVILYRNKGDWDSTILKVQNYCENKFN